MPAAVGLIARLKRVAPAEAWRISACSLIAGGALLGHRTGSLASVPLIIAGAIAAGLSLASEDSRDAPLSWWIAAVGFNVLSAFSYVLGSSGELTLAAIAMLACAATTGLLLHGRAAWILVSISALSVAGILALGWTWGTGVDDVVQLVEGAGTAVCHLQNPYAVFMAQVPYFHYYPYLPAIPLMSCPFAVVGDVRVGAAASMLTALVIACLMARRSGMRGGRLSGFALLAITFPLTAEMIQWSFADVFAAGPIALYLYMWRSRIRLAAVALAVGVSTTIDAFLPLLPLFVWILRTRRQALFAFGTLLVSSAVFASGVGIANFLRLTVFSVASNPNIANTLNINGLLSTAGYAWLPSWVGLCVGGLIVVFVFIYVPRDLADALVAAAMVKVVISLVAKYAQDNHYLIPALLVLIAVAIGPRVGAEEMRSAPGWNFLNRRRRRVSLSQSS